MQYKWYEKDGHILSEQVVLKKSNDFRLGRNFETSVVIALNVGKVLAKHICYLHNQSIASCGKGIRSVS